MFSTFIVGVAYQEAYKTETKSGVPRVELSSKAKEYWQQRNNNSNSMCLEYRECFMVNGLHDYYIQDGAHGFAENAFEQYQKIIEERISGEVADSTQYKWWWYGEFLKSEIERNQFIMHT